MKAARSAATRAAPAAPAAAAVVGVGAGKSGEKGAEGAFEEPSRLWDGDSSASGRIACGGESCPRSPVVVPKENVAVDDPAELAHGESVPI